MDWQEYEDSQKVTVTVDIYDGALKPLVHRLVTVDPPVDCLRIQEGAGKVASERIGRDTLVLVAEWGHLGPDGPS